MNKPELQRHADRLADSLGELLQALRCDNGQCLLCGASQGVQHTDCCPGWPAIKARGAYRADTEVDQLPDPERMFA